MSRLPPASFDVAITTYKRSAFVLAAVRSCLTQGPLLNQVIVVDDRSEDDTEEQLSRLGDSRIVFFQRTVNGGIGPSRNDALERSTAAWTIQMDSDHELCPGAIERFAALAEHLGPDVGIMGARYRWDTGSVTPEVVPKDVIDYQRRIEWSSRPDSIGADYLSCISKQVRDTVSWHPARHGAGGVVDTLFQLDAARVSRAVFTCEMLGYQKSDAPAGHSRGSAEQRLKRRYQDAEGSVVICRQILLRHGMALDRWGTSLKENVLQRSAVYALLAGKRKEAIQSAGRLLSTGRPSLGKLSTLALCLLGRRVFDVAYRVRG